jgi:catechol 2,3-dioxygenase-like lactoylglutathione lyase family enzyme
MPINHMLTTSKPICFAATTKPQQAKKFYGDTLGLKLVEDTPFALVFDADGTMLRVQKVREVVPAGYTILGWQVDDIGAIVGKLVKEGARFERYDGLPQDDKGIWTTPDGSRVAWFKDPDGNTLSLTEFAKVAHRDSSP